MTDIYIKTEWSGISSFSDSQIENLCEKQSSLGCQCDGGDKGIEVQCPTPIARKVIRVANNAGFNHAVIEDY
jgi:hypothetical protein